GTSNTIGFSEFSQGHEGILTTSFPSNNVGAYWSVPTNGSILYVVHRLATPNSLATPSNGVNFSNPRSWHEGGVHVGLLDGSVRFVSENIDADLWVSAHTPNGGEVVGDF